MLMVNKEAYTKIHTRTAAPRYSVNMQGTIAKQTATVNRRDERRIRAAVDSRRLCYFAADKAGKPKCACPPISIIQLWMKKLAALNFSIVFFAPFQNDRQRDTSPKREKQGGSPKGSTCAVARLRR